jgi:hypothetical protein
MFILSRNLQYFGFFLEPAAPKPEIHHSILLERYPSENLLQERKKPVLISHLNPFGLVFCWRKQIEISGGHIGPIGWGWHAAQTVFFGRRYRSLTCVNRAIVNMNHKSFLMRHPFLKKEPSWGKFTCSTRLRVFVTKSSLFILV